RLDGEIEEVHEAAAVGDRLWAEEEDKRKGAVERDEEERGACEENRPGDGHRSMVQVGPESAVQSLSYDLTIANSDDVGSRIFCNLMKRMHRSPSCPTKRSVGGAVLPCHPLRDCKSDTNSATMEIAAAVSRQAATCLI